MLIFLIGVATPSEASEPANFLTRYSFLFFGLVDCCAIVLKQMFTFSDTAENINR